MILDGKLVADEIKQELKTEILSKTAAAYRVPKLVIISVGEDPASKVYVKNKIKACEEIGIKVEHLTFPDDEPQYNILRNIDYYNDDFLTDGIMVQLPLPKDYNERKIIDRISPEKDVDGLTTTNIGKLRSGQPCFQPCTARGIIDLLDYYNIEVDGKDVTIVGRSNIVGKPLADLMMARGATITQCHSHTVDLKRHTISADIIISAVGKSHFINCDCLGLGQTLIDVGINRDESGKLCGDIDVKDLEDYNITPVPGGVGPMTVAELMKNTVESWRKNICGYNKR